MCVYSQFVLLVSGCSVFWGLLISFCVSVCWCQLTGFQSVIISADEYSATYLVTSLAEPKTQMLRLRLLPSCFCVGSFSRLLTRSSTRVAFFSFHYIDNNHIMLSVRSSKSFIVITVTWLHCLWWHSCYHCHWAFVRAFREIKLVIYWILLFNLLTAKTIKALLMCTHAMFAFYAKIMIIKATSSEHMQIALCGKYAICCLTKEMKKKYRTLDCPPYCQWDRLSICFCTRTLVPRNRISRTSMGLD